MYHVFSDYKTHLGFRGKYRKKKNPLHRHLHPQPVSQVSYTQTIRRTPIFLPNLWGESASYSLKNCMSVSLFTGGRFNKSSQFTKWVRGKARMKTQGVWLWKISLDPSTLLPLLILYLLTHKSLLWSLSLSLGWDPFPKATAPLGHQTQCWQSQCQGCGMGHVLAPRREQG